MSSLSNLLLKYTIHLLNQPLSDNVSGSFALCWLRSVQSNTPPSSSALRWRWHLQQPGRRRAVGQPCHHCCSSLWLYPWFIQSHPQWFCFCQDDLSWCPRLVTYNTQTTRTSSDMYDIWFGWWKIRWLDFDGNWISFWFELSNYCADWTNCIA